MSSHFEIWVLLAVVSTGCGTVVGNPKKPKEEPKDAIVFKVPTFDLSVPSAAKDLDLTSFPLTTDDAINNGDKGLLTEWALRLDHAIARINGVSNRVNKILDKKEDDVVDGVLVFKNRGEDNLISGKVQSLPAGGDYGFEAVFCYDGKLMTHMRWNEAGDKVELTRDFGVKTGGDDDAATFLSNLKLVKTTKVSLDFATQGTVEASEGEDGSSRNESSHVEKDEAGFRLRMVGDSRQGTELPEDGDYEGDRYLVGQITDEGAEYAGFGKVFKMACKFGFDEAANDLWHPLAGGPRFCVGRPAGGKRFSSVAQYYDTLNRLEAIGIQKKTEIHAVKFADGLSCE